MSLIRPVLNWWLGLTERPFLARISGPVEAREKFEKKARLLFRAPRRSRFEWENFGDGRPRAQWARGPEAGGDGVILYFHGGGYFFGSPNTHRAMLARLSQLSGLPALLPQYRLTPEHVFPAAVEDALAMYHALLARGISPDRIVLGGDSAGGGLALALLAEICGSGLPVPALTFALSPWTDLSDRHFERRATNPTEVVLPSERLAEAASEYLGAAAPDDPRASPVFASFPGSRDVLIYASDSEVLFDDSRRMAETLRAQGVPVDLTIERGLPHVWPIFHWLMPEADRTLHQVAAEIRRALRLPAPSIAGS